MSERFNGRSAEVLATTPFDSAEHLADTIKRYVLRSTISTSRRKHWATVLPFRQCVYNMVGLDSYRLPRENYESRKSPRIHS